MFALIRYVFLVKIYVGGCHRSPLVK